MPVASDEPIHIALTFNDSYWAPAYATMRSVCISTAKPADLVFHLIHVGLSEEHQAALEAIATEFSATLVYYDLNTFSTVKARIAALPVVRGRHTPIVYMRLFLPELLPAEVSRMIYLDCDMMVRVPIEQLYNLDLGDNVIAAAIDPYRLGFQTRRDLAPKRYFNTAEPYFNSGLLVIDRQRFAAADIVGSVAAKLTPEEFAGLYYDQDMLNIALRGRWHQLDVLWNLQNPTIHHEAFDPKVVHYTGDNKPWLLFSDAAFARHYRHLMTNAVFYRYLRERLRARIMPFSRS